MAKPKLNRNQRANLRKNIQKMISENVAVADIVRLLSERYDVAGETIRWYLKKDGHRPSRTNGRSQITQNGTIRVGVKEARLVLICEKKATTLATVYYSDERRMVRQMKEAIHGTVK